MEDNTNSFDKNDRSPLSKKRKFYFVIFIVLFAVLILGWGIRKGYFDMFIPSKTDNYVLIYSTQKPRNPLESIKRVSLINRKTEEDLSNQLESLKDYLPNEQWLGFVKQGNYYLEIEWNDGTIFKMELDIVPGKEVYIIPIQLSR